jgi:hypothetical protein
LIKYYRRIYIYSSQKNVIKFIESWVGIDLGWSSCIERLYDQISSRTSFTEHSNAEGQKSFFKEFHAFSNKWIQEISCSKLCGPGVLWEGLETKHTSETGGGVNLDTYCTLRSLFCWAYGACFFNGRRNSMPYQVWPNAITSSIT